MDLGLKGRKTLVTGATKGIGRAIAELFAAEGASVAICARNEREVEATVAALRAKGVEATGRALDVADGPALQAWVADAAAELGGLDVVVANVSALAISQDEASWQREFETDLMGTVRAVNAAMPFLEKSDAAAIVAVASVSGREVDFAAGPYGTFKAALIHYVQGLAYQLAPKNIRANTISPGNTYFEGGVWHTIEAGEPGLLRHRAGAQPDRAHGQAGGDGARRRVPRKPRGELHQRHQPRRRRRADPRRPVLIEAVTRERDRGGPAGSRDRR